MARKSAGVWCGVGVIRGKIDTYERVCNLCANVCYVCSLGSVDAEREKEREEAVRRLWSANANELRTTRQKPDGLSRYHHSDL